MATAMQPNASPPCWPPALEEPKPMLPTSRILVLSPSNLATDPRVRRQLRLLQGSCRLTAAGEADPQMAGVEFVPLATRRKSIRQRLLRIARLSTRQFSRYYDHLEFVRSARRSLAGREFDLILANDAESWPLGIELRRRGRVLFDAHEYTPREFEHAWWWRVLYQRYKTDLCRRFLGRADGMLTVCPGIAEEYARVFGVHPVVVRNVPMAADLVPSPVVGTKVRMIHHGGALPGRKIENMISLLDHLDDRFSLDLMLVPSDPRYVDRLRRKAANQPRVRFLDPVAMPQIAAIINGYDIGVYLLEPNSFNNLHSLPNKFFEFIQARLGVAIGPSPEMARIVREHDCGLVSDSFRPKALAAALQAVTPAQVAAWKQNAHRAARRLSWETESRVLREEIDRLMALGACVE